MLPVPRLILWLEPHPGDQGWPTIYADSSVVTLDLSKDARCAGGYNDHDFRSLISRILLVTREPFGNVALE